MAKNKSRIRDEKPIIPIEGWERADNYLRLIGDMQLQVNQAEHAAKDRIDKIKAELADQVRACQDAIKIYLRSLEAFAVSHTDDFKKQRSMKLNFGSLGWRKSTSIKDAKTTLDLIKQVFNRTKAAELIRVKETVDKDALAKLTDEQLSAIDARRKCTDVFFAEPDLPAAVDYVE